MKKFDAGLITLLPASDSGSTAAWGSKRINPRPHSCLCLTWNGYSFKRRRRRRHYKKKPNKLRQLQLQNFDSSSPGMSNLFLIMS